MLSRTAFVLLILLSFSCSYYKKDFDLTDNEREFLSSFKKGDEIYYVSSRNDIDSILVLGVDSSQKKHQGWFLAPPASNNIFVSIKHLPTDPYVSLYQTGSNIDTVYNAIITISKYPQTKKVEYFFQFKRFSALKEKSIGVLHTTPIIINGKSISNYYTINDDYIERDTMATDIQQIYWTKNEGLVAYKYANGTYWVKKDKNNLPK